MTNVTVLVHAETLSPQQLLLDALGQAADLQDVIILAHRKSTDGFDASATAMTMMKAVAMAAWGADHFMRGLSGANDG